MTDHIHKVAGHFAGKLYSWDVVNEVFDPASPRPDGLRETPWLQNCGVDYLELAFRAAAAADPKALLVWNENYLEVSNGFGAEQAHRHAGTCSTACWRAAFPSRASGSRRICGRSRRAVLGDASYEAFLGQLARRGMKIFITELDVQDVTLPADPGARDRAVAAIYSKFLTATLRQPAVRGIVTWGLADRFSWIAGYRPRRMVCPCARFPSTPTTSPKPRITPSPQHFSPRRPAVKTTAE